MLIAALLFVVRTEAQFAQNTYSFNISSCTDMASLCSDFTSTDYASYDFFIDGSEVTDPFLSCGADTFNIYMLGELDADGFGPFNLTSWRVNGNEHNGTFNSPTELVSLMNTIDPTGNWNLELLANRITGGNPANTYANLYAFSVNLGLGQVMTRQFTLSNEKAQFSFAAGTHIIEAFDGVNLVDEAIVEVICTGAPTYESVSLAIPTPGIVCPDLGALGGPVVDVSISPEPSHVTISLGANDCFTVQPNAIGVDSVAITYCDANNVCSTAYYVFDSYLGSPITSSVVYDTVQAPGSTLTYCIDTLQLPGIVTSVVDICADGTEEYVSFILTEETVCLKYRGLVSGGVDTSCIVVCDNLGFCDTTTVIVTTIEPNEYPDQNLEFWIEVGTASSTVLNTSAFTAPLAGITNDCPQLSGTFVLFRPQVSNYSVDFTGLMPGTERGCIEVTDVNGRSQMFNITVNVSSRSAGRDTIQIRNGDDRFWCFGPYELTGDPIEMFNNCPEPFPLVSLDFSGTDVSCVNIQANQLGFQELCMTICDANDICDVFNLVVEVVPNSNDLLPLANDDYFIVDPSAINEVDPLFNDISLAALTFAQVISGPNLGSAYFNADLQLVYSLDGASCGQDSLIYEVCNIHGCDQALVVLDNDCDGTASKPDVINRSGFSPNGDGVNDFWTLSNIEFYPQSVVKVYNRWGNRVFEAKAYQNNWGGTFEDAPIPDGTYYFIAELNEPGKEPIAGYIQVNR